MDRIDPTPNTPCGIISAITPSPSAGVVELADLQKKDDSLAVIVEYLETGILPEDEKLAKTSALTQSLYVLQDGVLYHVEPDSTLGVIHPFDMREKLFQQTHGGQFGGHLSDTKVHSELRRHYWWTGMRKNITQWTRGCLVCATQYWSTHSSTLDPYPSEWAIRSYWC